MHRTSPAPGIAMRVDDGESIVLGKLRLQVLHTPGHTADSMCLVGEDRVFTGDTLLIGGTGRTDLPSGDPEALYESLFGKLLKLDPALLVYPAHDYKGRSHSTIGAEIESNPRLQQRERAAFVQMMKSLDLSMPTHLTEALRTNMTCAFAPPKSCHGLNSASASSGQRTTTATTSAAARRGAAGSRSAPGCAVNTALDALIGSRGVSGGRPSPCAP